MAATLGLPGPGAAGPGGPCQYAPSQALLHSRAARPLEEPRTAAGGSPAIPTARAGAPALRAPFALLGLVGLRERGLRRAR